MKIFRKISKVFRAYSDLDRALSFASLAAILLMVLKMIVFPYGLFNIGEIDIYTEGLVGPNGFQNLNPLLVDYNDLDREVSQLVFSGLMKYDSESEAVVMDMADLLIDETKTVYTFVLNEGLKWQDGEDLTVDDVYFTFAEVIQDPTFPNEILKANFDGIEIEVLDEKTIKFTLEKPNVFFITSMTTGILPKHILGEIPAVDILKNSFNKQPIGSGPYYVTDPIEEFKDGRMQVSLSVNRYYYGLNPQIENFRFISYPTVDQLMGALHSLDGISKISGKSADFVKGTGDFVMFPYELPQYMAVFMNMDAPKMENKLVRISLQKSVDKEELLALLDDKVDVDTPLMQLSQTEWIYQADMAQANGAIYDAGYYYEELTSKYRINSIGDVFELEFLAREFPEGSPQAEETELVANYLKEKWESLGIKIDLQILPVAKLNERIMDRNYDLLFVGQTLGYNLDTYSYWHSTQVGANGLNLSNYKSFHVDSLIEDVRMVFEKEKSEIKLKMIAERLAEDVPAIFLYKPVYYYASNGKVNGIDMKGVSFPSDRFSRISGWSFN